MFLFAKEKKMIAFRQRTFQTTRAILGMVGAMIIGVVGISVGLVFMDLSGFSIGLLPLEWIIAIPNLFISGALTGIIIFALHLIHKKRKINWGISFIIIAVLYFVVSLAAYLPFLRFSSRYYAYSLLETGILTNLVLYGMYWRHKNNQFSWQYAYILTAVVCFCVGLFLFKLEGSF
jgi:hypothetical protein